MIKSQYWLLLLVAVAGASMQVAACSTKFTSCERTLTCTAETSDGGEAGSDTEGANGGQRGVEEAGGSAGSAGDAAGETGASAQCSAGETEPCWETESGAPFSPGSTGEPKGNCRLGQRECTEVGSWGTCQGAIGPQPADTCDPGDDASCNGAPNEGCECHGTETRPCGKNTVGNCKHGTQTCKDLKWGECVGEIKPALLDSCVTAGDDANCDGKVNDQCPCVGSQTQSCGDCGKQACNPAQRQWGACSAIVSQVACGNCGTRTCDANGSYSTCTAAAPQCADSAHSQLCSGSGTLNWVVSTCAIYTTCSGTSCLKVNGQACALAAECASGQCNAFYRDSDGDGYGTSANSVLVCGTTTPPGFVANNQDCCDEDFAAHPGQTAFFDKVYKCGGASGFDYNCSGAIELEIPSKTACQSVTSCTQGWSADSLPACGTSATSLGYHASAGAVYPNTVSLCH